MTTARRRSTRALFLAIAVFGLATGLWAGLLRVGWQLPQPHPEFPGAHGPLMVCGFLGVLVILERAAAIGAAWALAGPVLLAGGSAALLTGLWPALAPAAALLSSLLLAALYATVVGRRVTPEGLALTAGALLWAGGNLLWLAGKPIAEVVYWWAGFLVLTIFAERRELARVWLGQRGRRSFVAAVLFYLVAVLATRANLHAGARLVAAAHVGLLAWLVRYDPAPRALGAGGLRRFMAVCMVLGFAWLAVSAALMAKFGALSGGPVYDAIFHAIFVGFVFSMIFAHAPVVVPSLLATPIEYSPLFYAHLMFLHASLLVRIAADVLGITWLRMAGAFGTTLAIVLFAVATGLSAWRAARARIE